MELNKIYFMPGDVVELKQDIPNKPTMIVVKKKTLTIKPSDGDKSEFFQGMLCMWFTSDGLYQEKVFSTKYLIKI